MSIFRSTIWLIAAEVVFTLSGYAVSAVLGRVLGPAEFGRYTLVIGFTTMLIILLGRAIPTAMSKHISQSLGNWSKIIAIKRTAARWQYSLVSVVAMIFFLLSPFIAGVFGDKTLTPLFQLSSLMIPAFALSSFHIIYFNGLKYFGAMGILKMARGLFRLGWIVGLAMVFYTTGAIAGAILAPLSVFALALILDYTYTKKRIKQETVTETPAHTPYPARKLLRYAGGFMLFLLFYEFFVRTDIYLIKIITANDTAVGLYVAAMTIALIPYYLLYALSLVLFPVISSLTAGGNHYAKTLVNNVLRLLIIILIPTAVLMGIFSEPLIRLFFGTQFVDGAYLIGLMIGGTIFGTVFYILAAIFNGAGLTRIPATIAALAIMISIGANMLFLPKYGIGATAIIFSLTSVFMGLSGLYFAGKIFAATINSLTLLRTGLTTVIIYFIAQFIPQTLAGMIVGSSALYILYFVILIFAREITKNDLKIIKQSKK